MNGRIRVRQAIGFVKPDLIPVEFHYVDVDSREYVAKLNRLYARYEGDFSPFRRQRLCRTDPGCFDDRGQFYRRVTDEWGTVREQREPSTAGAVCHYPLTDWTCLSDYCFPSHPAYVTNRKAFLSAKLSVERKQEQFFHMGHCEGLFGRLTALRPLSAVIRELTTEDPRLMALLDQLTEHYAVLLTAQLRMGVDGICFLDTLCEDGVPLISPSLFCKMLAPYYRRLAGLVRKAGGVVHFDSREDLTPFLPLLKELGADSVSLHPTDQNAASLAYICRSLGLAAALHLDDSRILHKGTPEEVRRWVVSVFSAFRPDLGGSWFHIETESDVPFVNLQALVETVYRLRFG